jgi:hypothetical protein
MRKVDTTGLILDGEPALSQIGRLLQHLTRIEIDLTGSNRAKKNSVDHRLPPV